MGWLIPKSSSSSSGSSSSSSTCLVGLATEPAYKDPFFLLQPSKCMTRIDDDKKKSAALISKIFFISPPPLPSIVFV